MKFNPISSYSFPDIHDIQKYWTTIVYYSWLCHQKLNSEVSHFDLLSLYRYPYWNRSTIKSNPISSYSFPHIQEIQKYWTTIVYNSWLCHEKLNSEVSLLCLLSFYRYPYWNRSAMKFNPISSYSFPDIHEIQKYWTTIVYNSWLCHQKLNSEVSHFDLVSFYGYPYWNRSARKSNPISSYSFPDIHKIQKYWTTIVYNSFVMPWKA